MENFVWDAVPSQRQRKVEKYDYPVMTMAALSKPGAGRKFSFNKAAQELLNIQGEDRISFGFNADRTIVAVRKADGDAGFKLTKTCTLSDKKTFEFISKILKLSNNVENEFKIVSDIPGLNTLVLIKEEASIENYQENNSSTEEILDDSTGNVNYPTVEEGLELTPSEDVSNNQW
jgi:hypothetical protein